MALPDAQEFAWARQRRANIRVAGGILDLVLPLREGGDGTPVFCAPPLVGVSWCYLALLPYVELAIPVYALQSRGLRRPEPLPVDLAELARDFADQIRITRPHGPYCLFGWSIGGNMAHAIAGELERRGHEVALLAIADATPMLPGAIGATDENMWLLCNFLLREFGYQPAIAVDELEPEARMLALVRDRPGLGLDEWPDERVLALPWVIRNNIAMTKAYRPGRVRCPVLFAAATRSEPPTEEKVALWRPYVEGRFDVVEVDAKHEHMLLPQPIERIGARLSAGLRAIGVVS